MLFVNFGGFVVVFFVFLLVVYLSDIFGNEFFGW